MQKVDSKDRQILSFIDEKTKENGFPPSVREICTAVGFSSTSSAANRLNKLQKLGLLEKSASKNRSFRVVDNAEPEREIEYTDVPLLGRVAAGIPIMAVQDFESTLALPKEFVGDKELYILKIKGESMINAGILDGDYIIVNHQSIVQNGEIAVVLVSNNEEATVKTFYKENGHFRLQPENDNMEPIIVNDASVIGKVVGVYRNIK